MDHSLSPPGSPIPEIRITFPEEVDEAGRRKSGRVVVVRVGDHSVGLEPVQDTLPPYQQNESDRFHSLDLDRMGGLKEKASELPVPAISIHNKFHFVRPYWLVACITKSDVASVPNVRVLGRSEKGRQKVL